MTQEELLRDNWDGLVRMARRWGSPDPEAAVQEVALGLWKDGLLHGPAHWGYWSRRLWAYAGYQNALKVNKTSTELTEASSVVNKSFEADADTRINLTNHLKGCKADVQRAVNMLICGYNWKEIQQAEGLYWRTLARLKQRIKRALPRYKLAQSSHR